MSKLKGKDLTIIFGIALVFSSVFIIPFFLNSPNTLFNNKGIVSTHESTDKLQSVTVTDLTNITITGNANFATTATKEGWTGNGLQSTPYVIANYNITASGIAIINTTMYFDLVNITILQGDSSIGAGLSFNNVTHAVVTNVSANLDPSYDGFDILNSFNNSIINCTVMNNYNGIMLTNSWNNTLTNNTAESNQYMAIGLANSNNNTVFHSTIMNNPFVGFGFVQSNYTQIINNTLINNGYNSPLIHDLGIVVLQSQNNTLKGNNITTDFTDIAGSPFNTMNNNRFGEGIFFQSVTLNDSIQTSVTNNYVDNKPFVYWQNTIGGTVPTGAGEIVLMNTTNAVINGQTMSNAWVETMNLYSNGTQIINSQFSSPFAGIYAQSSSNITVEKNNFISSGGAIDFELVNNATINDNISNNSTLEIADSSNMTVEGNTFTNATAGYYFDNAYNLTVDNNKAFNDTEGFYLDVVTDSVFNMNSAINNTHSFNITSSSFNNFTSDTAFSHGTDGFLLVLNSDNNTLSNCTADYNSVGYEFSSSDYNILANSNAYDNSLTNYEESGSIGNIINSSSPVIINPTTTITQTTSETSTTTMVITNLVKTTVTNTVTNTATSTVTKSETTTSITSIISTTTKSTPGFLLIMAISGLLVFVGYKRRRK